MNAPIVPPVDLLPATPVSSAPWYDRFISRNAKALAASATAGLAWGTVVVHSSSAGITAPEWLALGAAAVQTFLVYTTTNTGA